jgi:DNA-binding transcriptional ArsR family regulator
MSMPAVSKHLRVLGQAGLLTQTKQGRSRRCRLVAEPLAEAAHRMAKYERFWEDGFVALEQYLNASSQNEQSEQKENTQ